MNYNLYQTTEKTGQKQSTFASIKRLSGLIKDERRNLIIAFAAILINAILSLLGPFLIGHTIDTYFATKQYQGILMFSGILVALYITAFFANYLQMRLMGGVGQRMLFSLRNTVFNKLQELPVDFFNQNKAGDLISRINNDTDKVNQFFSQSLMQFIGSIITMTGAAIFLLSINITLGAASLFPALLVWIFTKFISSWVKRKNAENLKSVGGLSAEIQESLNNFKVIIAFNRRDYFRRKFEEANQDNYKTSIKAGIANNTLTPVYGLAANIGQLIVLALGIYLITTGHFTIGLLISFIAYVNNFYHPLRQLAMLWANFQVAMAAWDRISLILSLKSNLDVIENNSVEPVSSPYISFQNVSFKYPNGKEVLHKVNFDLERGKVYAFVGPTGGGKTTTASLIARLYDATKGIVLLDGRDIRSFHPEERSRKIGFILQEPFLFTGTVRDNILYGNEDIKLNNGHLVSALKDAGLDNLIERFDEGLDTKVKGTGESLSLGQKQLIAFIRVVLRKPELLILDEATANIDTVTEQLLDSILQKLPSTTTRVIIAHRLNTIENADEIFFVNSGNIIRAGSLKDAVDLLLNKKRDS